MGFELTVKLACKKSEIGGAWVMGLAEPTNQCCGLNVGHRHGVHFYPGLLLLKMSHDGAFRFAIGDR